jgi:serine/threonine protein kinase
VTHDAQATVAVEAVLDGRYRLEGVIASGGVATVMRATDLVLDREVAVKLLKEATDCAEDRARFLLETHTLARLSHPGLVTMLDAGTSEDRPYLVMELVDGPSLSGLLDAPLALDRAAGIGAQVARALAYAHGHGVVHRDVKPGNVLLRSDGRVKLADFGIARLVGEHSDHTRTGVVVGSVHYLAPEQVAFEEITPAVDVYALGLLLLRCVTGRHAFDGPTIETALARLSVAPPIPEDLPDGWRELLSAMTARLPDERPTADEVAERLTHLGAGASSGTTTTALPPVRTRRLTPPTIGIAAAVLAALMYVGAALLGGPGPVDVGASASASEPSVGKKAQRVHPAGPAIMPVVDDRSDTARAQRHTARNDAKAGPAKGKHHKSQGKPDKGKGEGKSKGKGKGNGKGR